MLVLSRRAHQEIVFPNLGITVRVLQIRGQIVKIGIDAPKRISVARSEVLTTAELSNAMPDDPEFEHRLRNEINLLQLRVETLQRRLELGEEIDTESSLEELLGRVDSFDRSLSQHPTATGMSISMRLLVVEDCDNERKLMAYMLASHGFEVHVARDGAEAVHWLRTTARRPDVVLMDLQMPLADGLEALQQIRHDPRLSDLRVYAVTGKRRAPEDEPIGRSWDGWFTKPLDVSQLIRTLLDDLPRMKSASVAVGG